MAKESRPKSLRLLALELGVSRPTVQKYLDLGMKREWTKKQREKWVEARRKKVNEPQEKRKENNDRLRALEEELLRERIEEVRDRRRKRAGELVERKAVEGRWRRTITDARVQLENLPDILAKFLPAGELREAGREKVQNVIDKVLEGLASGK
jgi:predicted transcriptional regulator